MPAVSKAQQEMMGADLARARAGKPTRTGMSEAQLMEYASTKRTGLPYRAPGSVAAQRIASAKLSRRKGASASRRHAKAVASASGRKNR